ncbi:cation diffusion facilitator family transporter [Methanococcoides methylutens]|uniref:Cobalt-zinc-cadmium resistance protein n=1 Tax=Methanococcoides methylutens MM1 TaxID=1434104 RepID=A0A0E3X077_METMT|nr:cation diffusion facilitator family transporter [Methanococcoides methylutens]AKB85004.1 Cobalt-zinc-cadmium resistance protein [Methanococcoides methylutens MM1]
MWTIYSVKGISFAIFLAYLAIAVLELTIGIYANLSAIESIGYYSLFVCIIGSARIFVPQVVSQYTDKDHPYGYTKYGSLMSLFVAFMFILFGIFILKTMIPAISVDNYYKFYSFVIATLAVAIMLDILILRTKKEDSFLGIKDIFTPSLVEINLLLSIIVAGVLIFGTIYPLAEILVVFLIVAFLFKECASIIVESGNTLCDACRLDESAVCNIVNSIDGVEDCYMVRAHGASQSLFVDLRIKVMSDMHIRDTQRLVARIESDLKRTYRGVSDVFVHLEPL